ncbi:MAG: efflux transporter outer membrane subunit [Gammaproteobacteria bacterium]
MPSSSSLLLLVAVLAGCAVGPDYERPELAMPESWPEPVALPAVELPDDWWRAFGDPVLDGVVERALAENLGLRLEYARIAEARARLGLARAELYPSVALQAEANRQRQPSAAVGIENFEIPPRTLLSVAGSLSYEVDLWGGLARGREAAGAALERSVFAAEAVRQALAADVVSTWYALQAARRQLEIAERSMASRAETVRVQRLRHEAGLIDELALRQAEAELATVRAQRPGLEDAVNARASALGILLGLSPAELIGTAFPESGQAAPAGPGDIPVVLPAELLARRPDVRAAEAQLVAATAGVGVAVASRLPGLNLAALVGQAAGTAGDLFTADAETWSFTGTIAGPLLDFGRGRARVDTARAVRDQAELGYRTAVAVAVAEARDALRAYANSREALDAVQGQVTALERTEALAQIRYSEGYIGILELLDAQRGLLAAQLVLAETRAARLAAAATLFKALGGGWEG